jgi:hypothetical protein
MSLKTEDGEQSQKEPEKQEMVPYGVRYVRTLTKEFENEVTAKYIAQGWVHAVDDECLAFISPCGRWYDCFDRDTGQYYHIDQGWISKMNMKPSKKENHGMENMQ